MKSKILRVARTEYLNQVRTKAFIISVVLMPILMGGSIIVQAIMQDQKDVTDRRVAIVDGTGRLAGPLIAAAERRNAEAIWDEEADEREQTDAKWILETSDADSATLSELVRKKELFAYVLVPETVLETEGFGEVAYHTDTPTYSDLPRWIGRKLNSEIKSIRLSEAGLEQALVDKLTRSVPLSKFGLVKKTSSGKTEKAERVNEAANILVPLAAMMLLFMLVMMAGPALMNNVLEEKMQRISEVLVSSVSAFELFLGKLIGTALVSWTISILYLGGVAWIAHRLEFADLVDPSLFAWFIFFQLMALFIFGSIFSALGAACSELRDAQTMMMPAMLLVLLPMFTWFTVVESPSSTFSVALSLFPPATPFLMLIRLAVPPGPAAWEIVAAVVMTILFTIACVWAASRIFRVGILSQGQAPSFRKLVGWIFTRS